jgi:hypothetical protein
MIMMYVGLPRVDEEARARTLLPIFSVAYSFKLA